jgi:hypothetical protein
VTSRIDESAEKTDSRLSNILDATGRPALAPFSKPAIMRPSLRAAAFLALAIVAITCTDAPTGPSNTTPSAQAARLRMAPNFTPEAAKIYNSLALFGQEVTEVHVHLTAADGTQRDTVINFPAGSDTLSIEIAVPSTGADQQFTAVIELRNDQHTVLFSGTQVVVARAANLPPLTPPAVEIHYSGPGKGTKTVSITPLDPTASATATTAFSATAIDSSGNPVTDLLVRWTTSDATLATATSTSNTSASIVGLGKRGVATISAITPSGIVATSRLTLVPPATQIVVVSGGGQTGVAGSTLAQPLVVEVRASDNLPVAGANVAFRSITPTGSVATATAVTDASGRASTTMKLPPAAGTYQFEASSGALPAVTVSETATAAQPAAIAIVSGDQQADSVGKVLTLAAKVTDAFNGPVNGATVTFTRSFGSGTVGSASVVTGVDGLATTTYTLGNVVGADTVNATVTGVAGAAGTVQFALRTIARGAGGISIVSGGGQSGNPGAVLATPLVAKVVDALNNPVANASVTWSASGGGASFSPVTSTTTANGQVSTQATLGGATGPVTVTATTGALTTTTTLTVTSPPVVLPPTITKTAGDGQSVVAGTSVVVLPTVVVKDGSGNPMQGAPVVFAVSSGGGTATGTTATTNSSGVAVVGSWTLGPVAGANTLTATSGTLTTTFTATGTVGVANKLAFAQAPPASIVVGAAITPAVQVRLTDANGNPVTTSGVTITLTGAFTPSTTPNITQTQTTDATGTATFALSPVVAPVGSIIFAATAAGTSPLVSSSIPITAGAAAKLVILTQPPATVSSGAVIAPAISVQVSDAGGNPVSGTTTVTATVATGGGTLSGTAAVSTNGSAVASFANLILSGLAGPQTLLFSAPGLTSATSNPTTLVAGTAAAITKNAGDAQTAVAGTSVAIAPSVLVKDAQGNPVANVTVTFAVTTGGGSVTTATPATNASGIATVGSWTLGSTAGANSLTASVGANSVVFTATGSAGTAAKLKPVGTFPTTVTVGGGLGTLQIQLADANGNAVAQAGVVVTVTATVLPSNQSQTQTATTDAAGIASFPIPNYDGPSGTVKLNFTAPSSTPYAAPDITALVGPAARFIVKTQPSASAILNTPFPQQPVLQLTDVGNNPVATVGVPVTARIVTGGGTLNGTLTVSTDATGAATYTNLSIAGLIGTRQLGFANVTLDSAVSSPIAMGVGTAQNLVITAGAGPQTAAINTTVPVAPGVRVTDSFGNGVGGVSVTFTPRNGSRANGSTSPVTLTTPANGVVNVSWQVGSVSGNLADTLDVASGTLNGSPLHFVANVTAGAATQIYSITAPTAAASGATLSPAPSVRLVDASGNAVATAGVPITVAITTGQPTLSGTLTVNTNASGVATFSDLVITGTSGFRMLTYSSAGVTPNQQNVSITAGTAAKLGVFGTWTVTTTTPSGTPLPTQPVIQLLDASGNPVSQAGVVVTASVASGPSTPPATLSSPTATTDANGRAVFSGLAIMGLAGSYTLTFSAAGEQPVTPVTTLPISGGPAASIAITAGDNQTGAVGSTLPADPTVKVVDASGNPVANVSMTFTGANGSQVHVGVATATSLGQTTTLAGTAAVTWILGNTAGPQTMTVTVNSGPLTGSVVTFHATANAQTSSKFAIVSGQPASMTIGVAPATPMLVRITDSFGNSVAQAGVNVTLTGTVQPSNTSFTTAATTDASGVATFNIPAYTGQTGSATLTFTSGTTYTPLTTTGIPVVAGAAAKLVMGTQPPATVASGVPLSPQPTVQVTDAGGNAVAVSGAHVLASISVGGGTLSGPTDVTTNASGVAAFANLAITGTPGARQLTFTNTDHSLGSVIASQPVTVTVGAANNIAATSSTSVSGTAGSTLAAQPTVRVTDAAGSGVAGIAVTFAAAGAGSTVSDGTTTGSSIVVTTDATGQAKVTAWKLGSTAQTYTVGATASVPGSPVIFTAQGQAGGPTQLALSTPPSGSATNGVSLSQQPVVQVRDANGNVVAGISSGTITAAITSGTGTLSNATASIVSGVATFSGLKITGTSGNFTLEFTGGGYTSVSSSPIGVSGGALATITVTPNPATLTPGTQQQFTAVGKDASGNVVTITPAWSVTNGGGSITPAGGLFTAPTTAGSSTVSVTSNSISTSATVTTTAGALASIVVTPANPSMTVNGTKQFAASGFDANGNSVAIAPTWSVTGGGNIDAAGMFTAASTPGAPVVKATSGAINGTTNVTVNAGAVASITITPNPATAVAGGQQQFTAVGKDAAGNVVTITPAWSVTNGGGSITPSGGLFTAPTTTGSSTVFVTSNSISASATVTTTAGALASIVVTPANSSMTVNGTKQFTAAGMDAHGNAVAITPTWSVTGGGSIDAAGMFTAASTPGTPVVKAASGTFIGSTNVTVNAGAVASITITPNPATAIAGGQQQFTAVGKDAAGNVVTITPAWSVTNGGGSITPAGGLFTAPTTTGSSTVFVTSNSISASATVTTTAGALASIIVSPANPSMTVNGTKQFTAVGLDANNNPVAITPTWSVTGGGNIDAGGMFTAASTPGTPVVKATSGAINGTTNVTVNAGAVASITITPNPATAVAGGQQQFTAVGKDAAGNVVTITPAWSVTNGGGSITPSGGLFTAPTTPGTSTVFVTSNSISASATVTTTAGALASIVVTPANSSMTVNGTKQFTAVGLDANNNPVAITPTWSVTGGGAIDAAGMFTAASTPGTPLVKATSGAINGTATVTVSAGAATKFTLATAPSATVANGAPFATQPAIQITDAGGNPVAAAGIVVTAGITTGSGTVVNNQATTNGAGLATFSGTAINGTAGTFVLQFAGAYSAVSTSPITVTPGAAAKLGVITAPTASVASGVVFPTQPVIQITDATGNHVSQPGTTITASIFNGNPTLGGTLTAVTNASGAATFSGLVINGVLGSRDLQYTSGSLVTAITSVNVVAGAGTQLVLATPPAATATSGNALGQQPVVQLEDAAGNPVSTSGVTVTATIYTGSGTLANATAVTNGSGAATFSALTINGTAGSYVLRFDAGGYTTASSSSIAVSAGTLYSITVTPPSASVVAGATQQFTAVGYDQSGNVVSISPSWTVMAGGGTIDASTGLFTAGSSAGTYINTIHATSGSVIGLASVGVSAGALYSITVSPNTATVATGATRTFSATGYDSHGNAIAVTPAWTVPSGGGSIDGSGTFTGGTTAGTFPNTIHATSGAIVGTASVTVPAGAGAALALSTQPTTSASSGVTLPQQPRVQAQDANGNPVALAGVLVTATVTGGRTVTNATATTDAGGLATFSGLTISGVTGTVTLSFSATSLTSATSNTITIGPGVPAALAFQQQPTNANITIAISPAITVTLVDASGNRVTSNSTNTVTLAITSGTGASGAVLTGGGAQTFASGLATFSAVSIDLASTTYQLTATTNLAGVPAVASNAFTIFPPPVGSIVAYAGTQSIVNPHSTISANTIQFLVKDGYGAAVTGATVTYSTGDAHCVPSGSSVTNASGIATPTVTIDSLVAGGCLVTATAANTSTPATAQIAQRNYLTNGYVWFGRAPGHDTEWDYGANWTSLYDGSHVAPSLSTDLVYVPYFGLWNVPQLHAAKTIGEMIVAPGAGVDLNGFLLTSTGNIRAAGTYVYGGTTVSAGAGVTITGIFDALTQGTAGCGNLTPQSANLRNASVSGLLTINCTVSVDTAIASEIVATAGSHVFVDRNGSFHSNDSLSFKGDSLDIGASAYMTAIGRAHLSGALNLGSDAVFASSGATVMDGWGQLTDGEISVNGNLTVGGGGSSSGYTLTGGTLYLGGNFTQLNNSERPAYVSDGRHLEYFFGDTPSTVSFADGDASSSSFGNLQVANSSLTFITGSTQPEAEYSRSMSVTTNGHLYIPSGIHVSTSGALVLASESSYLTVNGGLDVGYCSYSNGTIDGSGTINGTAAADYSCYAPNKIPLRTNPMHPRPKPVPVRIPARPVIAAVRK